MKTQIQANSVVQDTVTGDLKLRNWGEEGVGEGANMRGKGGYGIRSSKSR
jgi:hypothetical protein